MEFLKQFSLKSYYNVLNIFNLGGYLPKIDLALHSHGLAEDFETLNSDQERLEKDYKIASDRNMEEFIDNLKHQE